MQRADSAPFADLAFGSAVCFMSSSGDQNKMLWLWSPP